VASADGGWTIHVSLAGEMGCGDWVVRVKGSSTRKARVGDKRVGGKACDVGDEKMSSVVWRMRICNYFEFTLKGP